MSVPQPRSDSQIGLVWATDMTSARNAASGHGPNLSKRRLKNLVRRLMSKGEATLPLAAAALEISPRSLQRHLKANGISYSDLLNESRYEIARSLLAGTALHIAEIGRTLGYNDPSGFSRAFTRWSGMSPRKFRMALQPPTKPPDHGGIGAIKLLSERYPEHLTFSAGDRLSET
jgi:AraC-like DNA-binding protein